MTDRPTQRERAAPDRRARPRLSRAVEVQEAVKDLILERRLAAGDPLPTESELMKDLRISRNSVREALKALQAVGIVDIRHGFGMFVGRMSLTGFVDELAFHSRITLQDGRNDLGYLTEIREVLESGLVQRLIDRPQELDLAPVAEVTERMEAEALAGIVSPETDRLFHELLYRPLGNPLVGRLLGAFWEVFYQLRSELGTPDETPADVARRHRDIYTAIAAGDKAAAVAAMHAHFDGVRGKLARLNQPTDDPVAEAQ
ncbi:FCD domain-containing protein [Plantactinospora sp. ZYX-F-223]|uniref:FadR/GntR family transcriptional regulator n=1 Tax=Plantactinospora sp. ZYX-F-223 TaxID=3144103 RepID=UPI0031FCF21F